MVRVGMTLAILMGSAAAVLAAPDCGSKGSPDILHLADWSASEGNLGATRVELTLKNASSKETEIVDATAWFYDALGESIGGIRIDRDTVLRPGGETVQRSNMIGFDRLLKLKGQNVQVIVCTEDALFTDGSRGTSATSEPESLEKAVQGLAKQ